MATIAEQKAFDEETRAVLYEGASISQLGRLFKMDNRMVAEKIATVSPAGERAGFPVYLIRDVAPYLVKPIGDFEAAIKRMNHRELPPMLLKEFWTSLKARREYEHFAGDLWATDEVKSVVMEAFKELRLVLLMLTDRLERRTPVTDEQRTIIESEIDRTMEELRARLAASLARPPAASGAGSAASGRVEPEDEDL